MQDFTSLFAAECISEYGIIDFKKLRVLNSKLLPKENTNSALMLAIPYRCAKSDYDDGFNCGLFARCLDYHKYFEQLFIKIIPPLREYTGGAVYGFADHSPIDEKDAAYKCGLGFIGKNSLLINKRFGSFVFIGTLLFEKALDERILECIGECGECTACEKACPAKAICDGINVKKCLSAISQKKRKGESETALLAKTATVWGCDLCQNACPYNKNAELGNIEYFKKDIINCFSANLIETMSDEEYKSRAFSFRERKVIAENILTTVNNRGIINTK